MTAMLRAACLLLLFVLSPQTVAQDLLSEHAFAEAFVRELRDQGPSLTVSQRGPLQLTARNAEEFRAFLDNAYKSYRNDPPALADILHLYAAGLLESWRSGDSIDPTRIVPVIKDTAFVSEIRAAMVSRGADADWRPAHDPYNAELVILYAEDTDLSTRYVSEAQLAKSGFSTDDRRARAVENLKALLPKVQAQGADGLYRVMAGGDYDVSLLLFDSMWQSGQLSVKGEIVVAIPARNVLFVTGSEAPEGLADLRDIIAEAMQVESYTLTDRLFVYREGKFVPFGS